MLKHREARYGAGRTKADGTWWKWKIDPLSVDAVLVYAQRGHGRRASLYTDFTFAVCNRVPVEAAEADAAIEAIARASHRSRRAPARPLREGLFRPHRRRDSRSMTGRPDDDAREVRPVRSVKPTLVFELGFEVIPRSRATSRASRCAFRACCGWRADKPPHEADTMAELEALLALQHGVPAEDESDAQSVAEL